MTLTGDQRIGSTRALERFNPAWPELFIDPYAIYDRYREAEPVHWGHATNPELPGSWYTFRFEECEAGLSDQRLKSDPASVGMADAFPPAFQPVAHVFLEWLGALDPPKHSRIRSVMSKAFTPRRVAALRPRMEAIAEELIQTAAQQGKPFDMVTEFAFPLPMQIIGDMLGVPEDGRDQFRELSTVFARAIDEPGNEASAKAGSEAALRMLDYFREQVAIRQKEPTDDLMNAMMVAANEEGQVMTEFEILATAIELIVAGHETTVNTVTKATLGLLDSGHYQELSSDPSAISDKMVEEILRWVSPLQRQRNRWVTEPMELGGQKLEVGQSVVVMLGAANHDPGRFPHPDQFDFNRPTVRHLTFGHGPHFCLGAPLARLEVGIGLRALMAHMPDLQLAPGEIQWRQNGLIPGPSSLVVERCA
jgi:cytochrome P450